MRIAVIGAGVSGLGAAWALKDIHEVTVFERESRLGGHANTVEIDYSGRRLAVDTGFVVFNERNYPNLTALLSHLSVASVASDMSFSVSDPRGFEWSSGGLAGLFAWKRNATRPAFLAMLTDILKFNHAATTDIREDRINGATLEEYVAGLRLCPQFLSNYLLPMGAAIWSMPERDMLHYPAASFLRFFDNHRLLATTKRISWRTIAGGSQTYVRALTDLLGERIRTDAAVTTVERRADKVRITARSGAEDFDQVIFACHPDQALAMLSDPAPAERQALSAIKFAPNTAYLHRDTRLMPQRRSAWASWNYLRGGNGEGRVCVSYWMNRLQSLDESRPVFVTLNPTAPPPAEKTFARFTYEHPQFTHAAIAAQSDIAGFQGARRTWFAGAWLGHGFHEDGLASGLAVAHRLGAKLPWRAPAASQPSRPARIASSAIAGEAA
jgi:predicted NAD/FAD-binding protein